MGCYYYYNCFPIALQHVLHYTLQNRVCSLHACIAISLTVIITTISTTVIVADVSICYFCNF